MNWLAIDIGGANLKISDGMDLAVSRPFAWWKEPEGLAEQLRTLIAELPAADRLGVTMTGELADCFSSKAEGVRFILGAVIEAADGREIVVYLTDGQTVAPEAAMSNPMLAAASNWHALAAFAGRYARQGASILLDIGSTTCDIIPLVDGRPMASGRNDTERLLTGELVYTGVERTPVCAVTARVPYRNRMCPVAQELFATTRDAYVVLGHLPEQPEDCETADGRPATISASCVRLGRMICADCEQFQHADATTMARSVADAQTATIETAFTQVVSQMPAEPLAVIVSGHGNFLASKVMSQTGLGERVFSLSDHLGPAISRAATAYALAVLLREASEP